MDVAGFIAILTPPVERNTLNSLSCGKNADGGMDNSFSKVDDINRIYSEQMSGDTTQYII
jgi:hypothetical protein